MNPLIIYPDSNASDYVLSYDINQISGSPNFSYTKSINDHWKLLSSVTPDARLAEPVLFIKAKSKPRETAGGSFHKQSDAVRKRYGELSSYLKGLEGLPSEDLDSGSISTAVAVLDHLSNRQIAPPELSWVGAEAIVMLWALGQTKYALTVTEGELGYVVRANGKTLRKDHDIALTDFDVRQLT